MKRVYIETYGCQMNEYDTEIVKTILKRHHYDFADSPEEAEVIFLNTCSVRENAHQKVKQRINTLKQLRRSKKELVLGVLGCMAQNLRNELLDEKVGVDVVAGPDSYKRLPEMLFHVLEEGGKESDFTLSEFETYSDVFPDREDGVNAWIAVMRGCDNFCTFCVVPYTRGRERSRDPFNVLEEVKQLAQRGFKQVTLLGQNVNSYRYQNYDFADLIQMVSEVEGIRRIRFTSPHPKDFPEKLIDVVANNPKACKHIHLPLQAGNDRILELMNRTYTQKEFLKLVEHMRVKIPGLVLTTDVIVGFPTETEEEFQDTLAVMRQVEFDAAFMFKYSERQHTIASRKYPDDVSEEEKTSRITRLVEMQKKIALKKNQQHLGQVFEVLIEGKGKKPNQLLGRNDGNKIVVFPDNGAKIGDFVHVKINEVTSNTLIGEAID
ncbi:MAG: tRNA (N6-isopentenyl adenosine(37)-C2)-methylthiotransferase MiaB [Caldisericaceae bacterium]|nr:tRNA (N6-isopentenyl adenosine(37)-C2)-methylthiotransferase MiaB [Caldisericaceae bacterium]